MRPSKAQWAMDVALVTAKRSTCLRRQVGCVLLNDLGHILATGYNGVASGMEHCNEPLKDGLLSRYEKSVGRLYPFACEGSTSESGTNLDKCNAVHAEQNALLQCPDVMKIKTALVTTSPCITCVKLLMNTSCTYIVYNEEYPHKEAKHLWLSNPDRQWILINPSITTTHSRSP